MDLGTEGRSTVVFTTPEEDLMGDNRYGNECQNGGAGRKGRLMRLAGWIDLENEVSVGGSLALMLLSRADYAVDWLCRSYSELYFA